MGTLLLVEPRERSTGRQRCRGDSAHHRIWALRGRWRLGNLFASIWPPARQPDHSPVPRAPHAMTPPRPTAPISPHKTHQMPVRQRALAYAASTNPEHHAIGYSRVPDRDGRSGPEYHTLEIQRSSIQPTAPNNSYELVDVLRDEDQSATSRNRPQFGIAMQRILASEADAIIVWKGSRTANSSVEKQPSHLSRRRGPLPPLASRRDLIFARVASLRSLHRSPPR